MARFPGRTGGMPRRLPPPEFNTVQNPTMLRGVQRVTGVRQAHVLPGLQEGLGAHIVTGDLREDPRSCTPASFAAFHEVIPDSVNVKRCVFGNPYGSNRIAVLRRLHIYAAEDWISNFGAVPAVPMSPAAAGPPASPYVPYQAAVAEKLVSVVYDLQPLGATVFAPFTPGQRLVTGYSQVGGASFPPDTRTDIVFPPGPAACGIKNVDPNGLAGAYIWRGVLSPSMPEILETFEATTGPRIKVWPGGTFEAYAIDEFFHAYFNFWWDEYPLT